MKAITVLALFLLYSSVAAADANSEAALRAQLAQTQQDLLVEKAVTRLAQTNKADAANASQQAAKQTDELLSSSDRNDKTQQNTLYGTAFGFLTLIAGYAYQLLKNRQDHEWVINKTLSHESVLAQALSAAQSAATGVKETQTNIKNLETNTNHIREQLVRVTGERAYAEGVSHGRGGGDLPTADADTTNRIFEKHVPDLTETPEVK